MNTIVALWMFLWVCRHSRAQLSVQQGEISDASSSTAILSMTGDALLKQVWWEFLPPRQLRPDEFLRYMTVPRTCKDDVISHEIQRKESLLETRDASIADYHSVEQIRGLGKMEITMWTLAYLCVEEPSLQAINSPCKSVILKEWTGNEPGFFTLWEANEENGTRFLNSLTARVSQLPKEDRGYAPIPGVKFRVVPQVDLKPCFNSSVLLRTNTTWNSLPISPQKNTEAGYYRCNQGGNNTVCSLGIASFGSGERETTTTTEVDNLGRLLSQLKNSYVQAHNSALNLEQGPPTEFWVVAIALPSTFIAVLTATVPLTNVQLRYLRPKLPRTSRYLKYVLLSLCNMVLAFISYLAVVAIAPAELQRERSFQTWALHADQVQVGDFSGGLRVLVAITGESKYKSNSLIIAWITGSLLLPAVAAITFYRCHQVFERQKLLMKLRAARPDLPGNATIDELQAVEMTLPDYLLLKNEIQQSQSIKLVRSATTRSRKVNV